MFLNNTFLDYYFYYSEYKKWFKYTETWNEKKNTFIDNESSNNYEMYMGRSFVLYASVIISIYDFE